MLLLSSCGPLTTPVAACATAAVALELGVNAIRAGKAKVMLVGGTEDFCEEGSYEFAQMGATSSGVAEAAEAREPSEASRLCASTMANHNRFGAHFAGSPIDVVLFRDEVPQPVTTMHLPSGYIGPHSTLDLLLSSDIRDTELSGTAELLRLAQHMQVAARSEAHGTVRLIGIEVPWKVRTRCEAECTLNLWSMEVAILRQQCESHAD